MPAAITQTSTSSGRSSAGTSTSSTLKAVVGGPKRSGRMSCASMRFGTWPSGGVSPSW
jgi:hypothetical protein